MLYTYVLFEFCSCAIGTLQIITFPQYSKDSQFSRSLKVNDVCHYFKNANLYDLLLRYILSTESMRVKPSLSNAAIFARASNAIALPSSTAL